jgi:hypothetical protein
MAGIICQALCGGGGVRGKPSLTPAPPFGVPKSRVVELELVMREELKVGRCRLNLCD